MAWGNENGQDREGNTVRLIAHSAGSNPSPLGPCLVLKPTELNNYGKAGAWRDQPGSTAMESPRFSLLPF